MNADKLLADGLDEKSRNNGRVNTAGEGEENLFVTNLCADFGNLFVNECLGQFGSGDTCHGFGTY